MVYDFKEAVSRMNSRRLEIIRQKGGKSGEGLPLPEAKKKENAIAHQARIQEKSE